MNLQKKYLAIDKVLILKCQIMKFIISLFTGLLFLFGSSCNAQVASRSAISHTATQDARNAVTRFLVLNNQRKLKSTEAKNLLTGEATSYSQSATLGQTSLPGAFKLIDSRHGVARVQGLKGKVPVIDLYFYVTLSGSKWKVHALRALALTGMIEMAMKELQKKPKLTEQERQELANMKLTLSLDRELRTYFVKHRSQFEQLRVLASQKPESIKRNVRQLGLSFIEKANGANLKFVIGGMVDNTVGYLYSPSNRPPKISDEEYIWVEKIADKWYLFRTT